MQKKTSKTDKKAKGDFGESAVCAYLIERGFEIICRNYRKPCGEIDIIAKTGDFIAFVEVKTRKYNSMVSGVEAVTKAKQRRLIATADLYLEETDSSLQPRYDIAEVVISRDGGMVLNIEYYEDAFDTSGIYTAF